MRNHLLEMQESSSWLVEPLMGLRPLFFRTLRSQEVSEYNWLVWKHQAHQAMKMLQENETQLVRMYIGFCKERHLAGDSMDKVQQFPSLGA